MLIVIEGADGCGKSTVAKMAARALGGNCYEFPCDQTYTGPMIRSYLRQEWYVAENLEGGGLNSKMGALAFQALQVTNRMEMMPTLEKDLKEGPVVLARYWQSGFVYGSLDGLHPEFLVNVHRSMLRPDINILLNLDVGTALKRRAKRDGEADPERYEGKREFTQKVIEKYQLLWGYHGSGDQYLHRSVCDFYGPAHWAVVDATRPIERVLADVMREVLGVMQREGF